MREEREQRFCGGMDNGRKGREKERERQTDASE